MPFRVQLDDAPAAEDAFTRENQQWFDAPASTRLRHFLSVASSDAEVECPFCSLTGPRTAMHALHLQRCLADYNKMVNAHAVVSLPQVRSRQDDPAPDLEIPDRQLPGACRNAGVDPGRCLCSKKHTPGNRVNGLNFFTPVTQVLRVCDFGHMKNLDELTEIIEFLRIATADGGSFPEESNCGGCFEKRQPYLRMTAGKRPGLQPVREWDFCDSKCVEAYVRTIKTKSKWGELLREWKT